MSQHVADVNLVSIIMHRRDQSNFVAADVEDGEFLHLIGMRKTLPQLGEIREAVLSHDGVPMGQRRGRVRVFFCELVQPLPCNDVHAAARQFRA